ncbi:BASS family bile acid:Na+ symporter [Roseibium hamelinense]|uniref:BASS family bile acid:Na+ symporter n=1 Tax=Roseibium hamelinense TaxID=150831 RepID=A0A562TA46_9HYPH|nr:sodium:proton symporter [Roseibium hamelinense]MTI45157.1 sodium:proton symporter [Roseibium hamelinense]TWI90482.1 BASS family bile acid:Na+ symporter [Roseibium hamelinense]
MIYAPLHLLGWIGRRGTAAVAASVLIGMTLPSFSALARPYLTEAVFVLLVLAFLRVDPVAVAARLRKPMLLAAASAWMMIGLPAFSVLGAHVVGLTELGPDIMLAVFIATAAPSVMSAPAFIYLMGLDGALSLTILIASVVATPLTAPILGELMLGAALPINGPKLALQLALLLGGAYVVAALIRKISGPQRIVAYTHQIDGLNVLVLLFFAIAAMDSVAANFASRPLFSAGLAALTFAVALVQIGLTLAVFYPAARADAFVIAHSAGARNMGLMVAALGGTLPEFAWLWFALGQLPIYMLPMILKPVARRYFSPAPAPTL